VFAGYFEAVSGRRLAYVVYVNNVTALQSIADVITVFADEGRISALLRNDS
jgi:D-alanyl-D-alanine carboxypeptidase